MATILIVDDSPGYCSVWRDLCEIAGYTVLEADGARKALALIQDTPKIDLVMTDYCMPEMNGYEFIRHLRGHDDHRRLPVLMLTGGNKALHDLMAQEGVTVLSKSDETNDILRRIRGIMDPHMPKQAPKPAARREEAAGKTEDFRIVQTRFDAFVPRECVVPPAPPAAKSVPPSWSAGAMASSSTGSGAGIAVSVSASNPWIIAG
ncbi:MAG: PleD family two-component system response regulator [Elusimicrobiota bacterium]